MYLHANMLVAIFLVFLIIILPILVSCILCDLTLWFVSPCSTTMSGVHGLPSSQCMATVYPIGIRIDSLRISLYFCYFPCLFNKVIWFSSLLSQ